MWLSTLSAAVVVASQLGEPVRVGVADGRPDMVSAVRELAAAFHQRHGVRCEVRIGSQRASQLRSARAGGEFDVWIEFVGQPNEAAASNVTEVARREQPPGCVRASLENGAEQAKRFWRFLSSVHGQAIWAK